VGLAVGIGRGHSRRRVAVAQVHVAHAAVLARLHHHAPGAAKEDLVEFRAAHLVRLGHRGIEGVGEFEARGLVVPGRHESGAPFLHADRLHLARHAQLLEQGHVGREQRLADMEPRMDLLLEEHYAVATFGQQGGGRRAAGAATDHDDVTFLLHDAISVCGGQNIVM
jgi:hypothetical protein